MLADSKTANRMAPPTYRGLRGKGTNPSRFGILNLGNDCALSTLCARDPVEIEDVGRYSVDFVVGERFRLLERHRAANIVE